MNSLIVTRGKEIIIFLVIIILILIMLLFSGKESVSKSIDPRLLDPNVLTFLNLLDNPSQNVYGVLLLAPNRHNKLVVLNKFLKPVEPCHKEGPEHPAKHEVKIVQGKVEIPPECKKNVIIHVDDDQKDQIIALTPGIEIESVGKQESVSVRGIGTYKTIYPMGQKRILFLSDLDHRAYRVPCPNPDGTHCH